MTMTVIPLPLLSDNYAWVLQSAGTTAIVDPAEAAPVIAWCDQHKVRPTKILLTHHHVDHIGGVPELVARYGSAVVGAKADRHRLPALDQAVEEGDFVAIGDETARVIATPGHTLGHVCYYFDDARALIAADTLFILGCGRVHEGTMADMYRSLCKLAALPPDTHVYCGHEYTLDNLRFALSIEPDNAALQRQGEAYKALRAAGKPTPPSTIADELAANPFMRAADAVEFERRRLAKNSFR